MAVSRLLRGGFRLQERIVGQTPSARAASGRASKNLNRLRFLPHDPDLWVATYIEPLAGARPGAHPEVFEGSIPLQR